MDNMFYWPISYIGDSLGQIEYVKTLNQINTDIINIVNVLLNNSSTLTELTNAKNKLLATFNIVSQTQPPSSITSNRVLYDIDMFITTSIDASRVNMADYIWT